MVILLSIDKIIDASIDAAFDVENRVDRAPWSGVVHSVISEYIVSIKHSI